MGTGDSKVGPHLGLRRPDDPSPKFVSRARCLRFFGFAASRLRLITLFSALPDTRKNKNQKAPKKAQKFFQSSEERDEFLFFTFNQFNCK